MVKYLIYGENSKKPIRKTKHENDAMNFITDFKNLQQYGCMTVYCEDDMGQIMQYNAETRAWEASEGSHG